MISTNSQLAAAKANQILGFYDTVPAMEQKEFTAGLVEMLSIYPPPVLDRAGSPSRGLAAYVAYPNLAKFKQLLDEWHAEHVDDLKRRGELRQNRERGSYRLLPPPPSPPPAPGDLANVHIPADHPRYAALVEWSKTAESRLWRFGKSSDGRDGIWIPLDVWQDGQAIILRSGPAAKERSLMLSDHVKRTMRQSDENREAAE